MKTPIVTAIGCAAMGLSVLAATPAQASHYSLDAMSAHMMSAAQARTLGVAGDHIRTFGYGSGVNEIPDVIWLCDLDGDKEVEVGGSPELYGVAYSSKKSRTVTIAGQELHAFPSEADARKAMKAIRKAATKCSGTFTVKDDQGWTVTQKATNGQGETAEGQGHRGQGHADAAVCHAVDGGQPLFIAACEALLAQQSTFIQVSGKAQALQVLAGAAQLSRVTVHAGWAVDAQAGVLVVVMMRAGLHGWEGSRSSVASPTGMGSGVPRRAARRSRAWARRSAKKSRSSCAAGSASTPPSMRVWWLSSG